MIKKKPRPESTKPTIADTLSFPLLPVAAVAEEVEAGGVTGAFPSAASGDSFAGSVVRSAE
ncbi:hypothetical protein GCM10023217_10230 [Gordonia alkaliphila]|uniref:Uncharacterized protein n=1 Tax=Gordonia alkaliphila TaxID=1053547 RepID=A0ABP8Z130_9ACTN